MLALSEGNPQDYSCPGRHLFVWAVLHQREPFESRGTCTRMRT